MLRTLLNSSLLDDLYGGELPKSTFQVGRSTTVISIEISLCLSYHLTDIDPNGVAIDLRSNFLSTSNDRTLQELVLKTGASRSRKIACDAAVAEEKCGELDGKIRMLHFVDIKKYLSV